MLLTSAAQTDIGLARSENEDRLLCADDLRLYAVADGIGGLPGGAEAAQLAVTSLLKQARAAQEAGLVLDLARAVKFANSEVIGLARRFAPDTGLGTTLTAVHLHDDTLRVASVGDSRCYLFRDHRLKLLTVDDTVEHEVAVRRSRGENVHLDERYRNALTRCIGQPMPLEVKVSHFPVQPGDRVLICSDGITRMVNDSVLAKRLGQNEAPALVLGALVADALAQGGSDNITGVLVDVHAG
jgi:Serine/threonine protein phosphatase